MSSRFGEVFARPRPLVAVVHLPPSVGCQGCPGMPAAMAALVRDLSALGAGDFDGVLLENDADKPHTITVSPAQVAWMTALAAHARLGVGLPLGINVQRADWQAALAIAQTAGLDFVRFDVFVDRVRMEGQEVALDPAEIRKRRAALGLDHVLFFTDVHVKHAELLSDGDLSASAARAAAEGSDAVLVTGRRTGEAPRLDDLETAGAAAAPVPVLVGSGLRPDNAAALAPAAAGALVGTALVRDGRVDPELASAMTAAWRAATG